MKCRTMVVIAAVAAGFTTAASAQTSHHTVSLGSQSVVATTWRADYVVECGDHDATFTLSVSDGQASVEALDLGNGAVTALSAVNEAFMGQSLESHVVTCGGIGATLHFRTLKAKSDGGADQASVMVAPVQSPQPTVEVSTAVYPDAD